MGYENHGHAGGVGGSTVAAMLNQGAMGANKAARLVWAASRWKTALRLPPSMLAVAFDYAGLPFETVSEP